MQHTLLISLLLPLYYASNLDYMEKADNECCDDGCFEPRRCNLKLGDALLTGENSRRFRAETHKCVWEKARCDDTKECIVPCFTAARSKCAPSSASACKPLDVEMYIQGVCCFLRENDCLPTQEICKMIRIFFFIFKGDLRRITILLAHCIHNTSGFKYLVDRNRCGEIGPYISRGILQVRGEKNYLLADMNGYFVRCPEEMASLSDIAIKGAINVYSAVVGIEAQCTFIGSWIKLNPLEVQGTNYRQQYFMKVIIGRLNVYFALCQTLGLPIFLGPIDCPFLYFCRPYIVGVCKAVNEKVTLRVRRSRDSSCSSERDCGYGPAYESPRHTPNLYSGRIFGYGKFECDTGRSFGHGRFPRHGSESSCSSECSSQYFGASECRRERESRCTPFGVY
ncbi:hypothetical protein VCUG_02352 [Vavraia culicis subsp. floridensis]|uniref:BPTI/Kunitz inhibitor domain-containing protein n=1 Tax=Vavraia culicis (isolate floridensis) TaxID=948595 RepID=L2GSS3_VAVCU|nr:uncharacterized protein VCUG_02352 [Vavraia culicis subsp. floridensis]ELA46150.1 hypothetical protein VCUG_02352 [Vavraia culicis subsp. floridensis]